MLTSPDFKELLSVFRDFKVRYMVVGGYAVMRYTEPRYTKDLDVWVATDPTNAANVFEALKAFGAPLRGLSADDFSREGHFYQIGKPPMRVDVMMSISGLLFESSWKSRNEVTIAGIAVPFISRLDLIRAKEASGRPQDIIDAKSLRKAGPAR